MHGGDKELQTLQNFCLFTSWRTKLGSTNFSVHLWSLRRVLDQRTISVSSLLKPEDWKVSFAPTPDDLYWENMSMSRRYLTLKKIIINIFLVKFNSLCCFAILTIWAAHLWEFFSTIGHLLLCNGLDLPFLQRPIELLNQGSNRWRFVWLGLQ